MMRIDDEINFDITSLHLIVMTGEQVKTFCMYNNRELPAVGDDVSMYLDSHGVVWYGKVLEVDPDEPRIVLEAEEEPRRWRSAEYMDMTIDIF